MSITTPSPVWSDDSFELFSRELLNGAATDLFDHAKHYNDSPHAPTISGIGDK
jgi:hypothetical protein